MKNIQLSLVIDGDFIRSLTLAFRWGFRRYNVGFMGGWIIGPLSYHWHRNTPTLDRIRMLAAQTNEELAS